MPVSPLNKPLLAAIAVAIAFAGAAAPCRPNPNNQPWETKVIYVKFEGCAAAEPKEPFDLTVGGEPVRFSKTPDGFWRGETANRHPIGSRKVNVDLVDMRARTACNVAAEPHDAGSCVALYRVACEELWLLSVSPVPEDAPASISYQRNPEPPRFAQCGAALPTPQGPGELAMRRSESIMVKVENLPSGPINVPLSLELFRGGRTRLTLRDVAPQAVAKNSAVSTNKAMKALKKGQLQLVLEDLHFTKN
ncbi:MAG TPA: hypothetical protein VEU30_04200 [Thermoanaerobaculia bacterium]|nr:hypothetical protein [Thermoanaerobaculia bacterium]